MEPIKLETVSEPGVYRLTLMGGSEKPMAKEFQRWVCHEVLPSIRRHGCFPPPDEAMFDGRGRVIVTADNTVIQRMLSPIFDGIDQLPEANQ